MEQRELLVENRAGIGKNASRRLRVAGRVPGIVYGKGMTATPVSVDLKELSKTLSGASGRNALLVLKGGEGLEGMTTIVADLRLDPLKGFIRHVDLHKVNMDEKVHVTVKIILVGTSKGVKEGGQLDFPMHTVEIECLPALIPSQVEVDVTELGLGQSVHVSDLKLPAGLKALADSKAAIVSILGRAKEEAPASA